MLICLITLRVCQAQITSRWCLQPQHSAKRGVIILKSVIKLECWMFNGVKLGTGRNWNQYFINQELLEYASCIDPKRVLHMLMHDTLSLSLEWLCGREWRPPGNGLFLFFIKLRHRIPFTVDWIYCSFVCRCFNTFCPPISFCFPPMFVNVMTGARLILKDSKEAWVFLTSPPVSVAKHWRACVKSRAWRGFLLCLCGKNK